MCYFLSTNLILLICALVMLMRIGVIMFLLIMTKVIIGLTMVNHLMMMMMMTNLTNPHPYINAELDKVEGRMTWTHRQWYRFLLSSSM